MEGQLRIQNTVRFGGPWQSTGWSERGAELHAFLRILGVAHSRLRLKGLQKGSLSLAADTVQTSVRLLHTQDAAGRRAGDVGRPHF
jgi:hypothetical protein